jgi:phthalate 4,5-dioxygenase
MGELMRRYWLPALTSSEPSRAPLPAGANTPAREDLVAFRDSNGRVGLFAEKCAHRRASLFYGRNEDGGLRCIYHGWKYDTEGNILDTPAEPADSMIKHHVKAARLSRPRSERPDHSLQRLRAGRCRSYQPSLVHSPTGERRR